MAIGTVSFFNYEKGYGFIVVDGGGRDAFVRRPDLAAGLLYLEKGDRVVFDLEDDVKGPHARNVRALAERGEPIVAIYDFGLK